MSYPIYIHNDPAGTLTERQEGLYRVFSAECPLREGIHRLWLHGGGRVVYLGLLAPEEEKLRLVRRFSRAAGLPASIDYAADSPAPRCPRAAHASEPALLWHAHPGGALTAQQGGRRYLALPAALSPSSPAAKRVKRIGGKDYLVFRR